VTAGQVHDSTQFESVVATCITSSGNQKPKRLAADKGYSALRIRDALRGMGIDAVIPRKSNEHAAQEAFDAATYRRRSVVEQCIGWLKDYRRIGTRFEKLAVQFLGMLQLAIIRRCLRVGFSDRA
jgi:transposase